LVILTKEPFSSLHEHREKKKRWSELILLADYGSPS
jgi:hypothetical protein